MLNGRPGDLRGAERAIRRRRLVSLLTDRQWEGLLRVSGPGAEQRAVQMNGGDQPSDLKRRIDRLADALMDFDPTNRQFEVGVGLALGESVRCIEQRCGIDFETVKSHRGALFSKAGVSSRPEFMAEVHKRAALPPLRG